MSGLLRSLHPEQELQHYVPVWRGDTWRTYDFTPGPSLPDYSGLNPPDTEKRSIAQFTRHRCTQPTEMAYAVLTATPQTLEQIAQASGLSYFQARQWVGVLVRQGRSRRVTTRSEGVVFRRRYRSRPVVGVTRAGRG